MKTIWLSISSQYTTRDVCYLWPKEPKYECNVRAAHSSGASFFKPETICFSAFVSFSEYCYPVFPSFEYFREAFGAHEPNHRNIEKRRDSPLKMTAILLEIVMHFSIYFPSLLVLIFIHTDDRIPVPNPCQQSNPFHYSYDSITPL